MNDHVNLPNETLLPEGHPWRVALDRLFLSARSLEEASFIKFSPPVEYKGEFLTYTHPQIPNLLVKAGASKEIWIDRIEGARFIAKKRWHCVRIPEKWIYPLPYPDEYPHILLCEKMDLVSHTKNIQWYREKMTPEMLNELGELISLGLTNIRPDNLPFCRDGTLALIDTENATAGRHQARFHRFEYLLRSDLLNYWNAKVAEMRAKYGIVSELIDYDRQLYPTAPVDGVDISYYGYHKLSRREAQQFGEETFLLLKARTPFDLNDKIIEIIFLDKNNSIPKDGRITQIVIDHGIVHCR